MEKTQSHCIRFKLSSKYIFYLQKGTNWILATELDIVALVTQH